MISVLLPVYNGGDYLALSVESLLQQTDVDCEVLIIDDLSTDGSYEYLSALDDARIRLFRNESNMGLFYNLNFLISKARGSLLKLWAQDDIMLPGCLKSFLDFHTQYPDIGFSYCQTIIIDKSGQMKFSPQADATPKIISSQLHGFISYYTGSIAGNISNTCISASALSKVGLFDEQMKISADFDMWVRLAEFFPTGHINRALVKLRDHSGQLSRNSGYLINHIREDVSVYSKLNAYIDEGTRQKGLYFFRHYKLVFYYTLMLQFLLGFKWRHVFEVISLIRRIDNFFRISFIFFRVRVLKFKPRLFEISDFQ